MPFVATRASCFVLFLFSLCGFHASVLAQQPASWTKDQIEQILKGRILKEKKGVGMVVGLIDANGKKVVGFGTSNRNDPSTKVNGETVFEIGSVSKVFTSLLLAEMVFKGEVNLNDPVAKFLPQSVTMPTRKGKEITLLDLATHTSSLPRLPTNYTPADPENPYADYTVKQLYEFVQSAKLNSDIGTQYEYSNLGAGLLGHVLALRAKSSFEELLSSKICKSLGMTSTAIALNADMKKRLSKGYDENLNEKKNWDIPVLAGAGAIRSTGNDMLLFLEANIGKTKSALSIPMSEQHNAQRTVGPQMSIGLGWHILATAGGEIVWHNGQTGGYHSFIGFDKKRGVGVVVLSNAAIDCDDIGLHLIDSKLPLRESAKEKSAIKVNPKLYDDYVGQYEIVPQFVMTVTKEQDKLMVQATGQPKFELFPESEQKFFLKVVDAQVSFFKDGKGAVTHLILHQNGANQKAKKR